MTNKEKSMLFYAPIVIPNHPLYFDGYGLCPHCHQRTTKANDAFMEAINDSPYLRVLATCKTCGLYLSIFYNALTGKYEDTWVDDYELEDEEAWEHDRG